MWLKLSVESKFGEGREESDYDGELGEEGWEMEEMKKQNFGELV